MDVGGVDEAGFFVGDDSGLVDFATGGDRGRDRPTKWRVGGEEFLGEEQFFNRGAEKVGGEEMGGEFGDGSKVTGEDGRIEGAGVESIHLAEMAGEAGGDGAEDAADEGGHGVDLGKSIDAPGDVGGDEGIRSRGLGADGDAGQAGAEQAGESAAEDYAAGKARHGGMGWEVWGCENIRLL